MDNGSEPAVVDYIHSLDFFDTKIMNGENRGIGHAMNQAKHAARGDFFSTSKMTGYSSTAPIGWSGVYCSSKRMPRQVQFKRSRHTYLWDLSSSDLEPK